MPFKIHVGIRFTVKSPFIIICRDGAFDFFVNVSVQACGLQPLIFIPTS